MKITKRDVEIMRFINEQGFCLTTHLQRKFGITRLRVYQLTGRLAEEGFLKKEKLFFGKPNIYYLTRSGAEFTNLPPISKINLGIYEHQIALTSLVVRLGEMYPRAKLVSERQLKHDNFFNGIGIRGHVSDGVLIFDDRKISVEVELTLKSRLRLERIFKSYLSSFDFQEVWYFCSLEVMSALSKLVEKKPLFKILSILDFVQ